MKIISETSLENFDAWSGGRDTLNTLIEKDLCDTLEYHLENDIFLEGCTDTELNDYLWFERDFIAELLGFSDWDELENGSEEDEEDEDEEEVKIDMELLEAHVEAVAKFMDYCNSADCSNCPFRCCDTNNDCENACNKMLEGKSWFDAMTEYMNKFKEEI